jgi:hypothetical protein
VAAHLVLLISIEIDQDIAARDQIDVGKRRIFERVAHCEQNRIADLLADPIAVTFPDEESPQAILTDVSFDRGWKAAFPRHGEGPGIEVRPEHLDGRAKFVLGSFLLQQHCRTGRGNTWVLSASKAS